MDRGWMSTNPKSDAYKAGVKDFIKFALQHGEGDNKIVCPCLRCCFNSSFTAVVVRDHLLMYGIDSGYTQWTYHGENKRVEGTTDNSQQLEEFKQFEEHEGDTSRERSRNLEEQTQGCPEKFAELFNASEQPLYRGCTKFTKQSAMLKLYDLKTSNEWCDESFAELLTLIKDILPNDNVLPGSAYEAKKKPSPP